MRFADLSEDAIAFLNEQRYDECLEKHEGPESWSSILKYYGPEILNADLAGVGKVPVLLPISGEQVPNIEVLRCVPSVGDPPETLTLFLRDRTYIKDPADDWEVRFMAGRLAVCNWIAKFGFYLTVFYHSRYETGHFPDPTDAKSKPAE